MRFGESTDRSFDQCRQGIRLNHFGQRFGGDVDDSCSGDFFEICDAESRPHYHGEGVVGCGGERHDADEDRLMTFDVAPEHQAKAPVDVRRIGVQAIAELLEIRSIGVARRPALGEIRSEQACELGGILERDEDVLKGGGDELEPSGLEPARHVHTSVPRETFAGARASEPLVPRLRFACVLLLAAGCSAQPPPAPGRFGQRGEAVARNDLRAVAAVEERVRVDARELPDPFPDREHVTLAELVDALEAVAVQLESEPAVVRDYEAFLAAHDLTDTPALFRDYVRVKLAFEATRDGGWWHLRWKITNEPPNSDRIWAQWAHAATPDSDAPQQPTAVAECDELSALFAFVVRRLGVQKVGLFWPVWNHVVAVWTVDDVRVVVPTSQVFIDADDSLGTDAFDPWKQKTIFTYTRRDVKPQHRIPAALARFFVMQARTLGALPQSEQQQLRNARSLALGGS